MKDQKTNDMLNGIFDDHYATFQDVRREMTQLVDYDLTDKTLEVHWVLGNKIDMGTKVFDLDKFEDWIKETYGEENDGEDVVWITPNPISPETEPTAYAMSLWDYTQENETDLVKEFYNKHK